MKFNKYYHKKNEDAFTSLNITPFIDLMLVLLVVFIVTAKDMFQGVNLNLPAPGSMIDKQVPNLNYVTISYTIDKKFYLNDQIEPVDIDDLITSLRNNDKIAKTQILLRGDASLAYGEIMKIIVTLKRLGYRNVLLVTQNGKEEILTPNVNH